MNDEERDRIHVLVDHQTPVLVSPSIRQNESGEECALLGFADVIDILEAWVRLSSARRSYRWSHEDGDNAPSTIIVFRIAGDSLVITDVEPFWSPGTDIMAAWDVDDLAAALGDDGLQWGEAIGEKEWL